MGQVILPSLQMSPTLTEADFLQNFYADQNNDLKTSQFHVDPALEDMSFMPDHNTFHTTTSTDTPGLLPSTLDRSPTERPATMSSLQRSLSRSQQGRPRQKSLSQINRPAGVSKHERRKSKELKRKSLDKKAFSNDPTPAALYGKRWEDLIDAATSATEEDSRDLTPVREALLTSRFKVSGEDIDVLSWLYPLLADLHTTCCSSKSHICGWYKLKLLTLPQFRCLNLTKPHHKYPHGHPYLHLR